MVDLWTFKDIIIKQYQPTSFDWQQVQLNQKAKTMTSDSGWLSFLDKIITGALNQRSICLLCEMWTSGMNEWFIAFILKVYDR